MATEMTQSELDNLINDEHFASWSTQRLRLFDGGPLVCRFKGITQTKEYVEYTGHTWQDVLNALPWTYLKVGG